jgi:hypothetical protein
MNRNEIEDNKQYQVYDSAGAISRSTDSTSSLTTLKAQECMTRAELYSNLECQVFDMQISGVDPQRIRCLKTMKFTVKNLMYRLLAYIRRTNTSCSVVTELQRPA